MRDIAGKLEQGKEFTPRENWLEQRAKTLGHVLTTRQKQILQVLASQKQIALRTLLDKLPEDPAPRTIQVELRTLSELGFIFSTGKGRSVVWSIQNR
jgi:Fe2+ or Zn2+ uptake regulation protein